MSEKFQPNKFEFKPIDLRKALVQKPKLSKITFKGIGNTGIHFNLPPRFMNFYDYVVMVLLIAFFVLFVYVTYWLTVMDVWYGYIIPWILWGAYIYAVYREYASFKTLYSLEITNTHFSMIQNKNEKVKRKDILLENIVQFRMNSLGPSVIYMQSEQDEMEDLFMEFSSKREQEWIISILRSIVYNVKKKLV